MHKYGFFGQPGVFLNNILFCCIRLSYSFLLQIVAVDPEGSSMIESKDKKVKTSFEVEGIGYDFVPTVLDKSVSGHLIVHVIVSCC